MYGAIILAAGIGTRFQGKKQFIQFHGKMLWEHVYDTAKEVIPKENIIVVGVDIEGGRTRTNSVRKGINFLSQNKNITRVAILEAARPLVTGRQIEEIMQCNCPSCTYVQPLVNTIIGKNGVYLNREDWLAMTSPNAFEFSAIKEAYNNPKFQDLTDDTRIMFEQYGIKPHFHEGGDNLFKVTYSKDISVLENIWKEIESCNR